MMTSMTQTITRMQPPAVHIQLSTPKLTLFQKIDLLVLKMEACPHFSSELKTKLQKWRNEFPACQDSNEAISLALCKLACAFIHKAIALNEGNEPVQLELLAFEDTLIELLYGTLPADETPQDFIEMYKTLAKEKERYDREVEKIQTIAASISSNTNQAAIDTQNALRQMHSASTADVSSLNLSKQQHSVAACAKATLLQAKQDSLTQKNLDNAHQASNLGARLQQSQKEQDDLVQYATKVLGD